MKLARRMLPIICAVPVLFQPVFGKSGTQCFLDNCHDRGQWVICITYDDATGRVLFIDGTSCDGTHWKRDHFEIVPVSEKVRLQGDYSFNHNGWQMKLDVDANERVAHLWVIDAHGMKWEVMLDTTSKL